eukprot:4206124-Heterocapsa_arctica.AAC.1
MPRERRRRSAVTSSIMDTTLEPSAFRPALSLNLIGPFAGSVYVPEMATLPGAAAASPGSYAP